MRDRRRKQLGNGVYECFGCGDGARGRFLRQRFLEVIGGQPQILDTVERPTEARGKMPRFNELQAKSRDNARMGFWQLAGKADIGPKQRCQGSVEHGIIGAVGGAARIAKPQQNFG